MCASLEFRPDAPPEEVARAAAVIRASAHQALEDLRAVIGILRDGADGDAPQPPQPTLAALPELLEESRAAGMRLHADVRVADLAAVPDSVRPPRATDRPRGADKRTQTCARGRGRSAPRRRAWARADDRGAQPGASPSRRRIGDPRRRDRPRRTGRARHAFRRPPRARTRRGRRLSPARLVAVAAVSKQIRVLVVDDDALVRAGLAMLLAGAEGIAVVGEAADGSDVAQAVAEHEPDIVLMDIRMPGMDGLAATELVRAQAEAPEVIVLTTFEVDDYVLRALRAGASGFLLKDTPPADIVRAVRTVAAGEPMLSPTITRRLIGHVKDSEGDDRKRHAREQLDRLTEREREVAVALGQGKPNAEISRELYMSVATVKAHVSRVLEKLELNNRVQIALLAHDAGEA